MRHAPSLTSSLNLVEAETLPSWQVLLSCRSTVLWPPPTSHLASLGTSPVRFIPVVTAVVACRPDETSPVPSSTVATSRTPYPGEFFAAASQGLWTAYVQPPLLLPSPCVTGSALSFSLSGQHVGAASFTLCYGLLFCFPFSGSYNASTQSVTRLHRLPAIRRPDTYRNWTFTSRRR